MIKTTIPGKDRIHRNPKCAERFLLSIDRQQIINLKQINIIPSKVNIPQNV